MSTPFISQIEIFSFNFAPKGWAMCNGQLLPINQNQALFSLLGTTYGGDGRVNFGLPDLRSRTPVTWGQTYQLGERGGLEAVTINNSTMPQHSHTLMADNTTVTPTANIPANTNVLAKNQGVQSTGGTFNFSLYSGIAPNNVAAANTIGNMGGSQAHNNLQPYLTLNFSIALQGIFPSQN